MPSFLIPTLSTQFDHGQLISKSAIIFNCAKTSIHYLKTNIIFKKNAYAKGLYLQIQE